MLIQKIIIEMNQIFVQLLKHVNGVFCLINPVFKCQFVYLCLFTVEFRTEFLIKITQRGSIFSRPQ